jgi:hypothetical protein
VQINVPIALPFSDNIIRSLKRIVVAIFKVCILRKEELQ